MFLSAYQIDPNSAECVADVSECKDNYFQEGDKCVKGM